MHIFMMWGKRWELVYAYMYICMYVYMYALGLKTHSSYVSFDSI